MARGLMTEYEWRKAAVQVKRRPNWWGAQCIYPSKREALFSNQLFRFVWLMISVLIAFALPVIHSPAAVQTFEDCLPADSIQQQVRSVKEISYQLPSQLKYQQHVFSDFQLLQGNMMLVDELHPLPEELPAPNTVSVALYSAGNIPVRSLQLSSGYDTIEALESLFLHLKKEGADGLYVVQGTQSPSQQKQSMLRLARELMKTHDPDEAAAITLGSMERPGASSLLQEYTVEIVSLEGKTLEETPHGQLFLRLCWRYGFVRESEKNPFRFRYVGTAHATAMTYLNLDLKSYLSWLHKKGCIAVSAGEELQYLILCEPLQNGYAGFHLPESAFVEVSADNTGYALAACTF